MAALDTRALRNAFGSYLTGVTVVTSLTPTGQPVGFTANSFTSVSLDPPLLLVCPATTLSSFDVFRQCTNFAVSVLAEGQQKVSNVFASAGDDRFSRIEWSPDSAGCPCVDNAAVTFSCTTYKRIPAGDHLILIGQVAAFQNSDNSGLGYSNNGYFSLGLERAAATRPIASDNQVVGLIVEHQGKLLLQRTPLGLRPLQAIATSKGSTLETLHRFIEHSGLVVDIGPLYSMFENAQTGEHFTYYRALAREAETAGLGEYVPIDALPALEISSWAIRDMLDRYALERDHGVFCLYLGDDVAGEVHMFGEGSNK